MGFDSGYGLLVLRVRGCWYDGSFAVLGLVSCECLFFKLTYEVTSRAGDRVKGYFGEEFGQHRSKGRGTVSIFFVWRVTG